MLLAQNPERFRDFLTGNTETNQVRSEVTRRLRLYQKAETYLTLLSAGIPFFADQKPDIFREGREAGILTMGNLPLFYSSREFKHIGSEATKIRNSRSMGCCCSPLCLCTV